MGKKGGLVSNGVDLDEIVEEKNVDIDELKFMKWGILLVVIGYGIVFLFYYV